MMSIYEINYAFYFYFFLFKCKLWWEIGLFEVKRQQIAENSKQRSTTSRFSSHATRHHKRMLSGACLHFLMLASNLRMQSLSCTWQSFLAPNWFRFHFRKSKSAPSWESKMGCSEIWFNLHLTGRGHTNFYVSQKKLQIPRFRSFFAGTLTFRKLFIIHFYSV